MTDAMVETLGSTSGGSNNGGNGSPADVLDMERVRRTWEQIEIWKPPTDGIRGYMWLQIDDKYGIDPPNIIKSKHPWIVRCHVWLFGDIWKCVCGTMCCDVCFEPCHHHGGNSRSYPLKDLVGRPLCADFKGCDHYHPGKDGEEGYVHFDFEAEVPEGALPSGPDGKPETYEWTGTLSFVNPCGEYEGVAGFQSGELAVYGD